MEPVQKFAPGGFSSPSWLETIERSLESAQFGMEQFIKSDRRFVHGAGSRPILEGGWPGPDSPVFRQEKPASAAEIHNYLDLEAEAETARAQKVLAYKRMYPSNAFITRAQVRALCLKYNLVFAPDFMFAGEIPEKNMVERARFKLNAKHDEVHVALGRRIMEATRATWRGDHPQIESTSAVSSNASAPVTVVIDPGLVFVFPTGIRGVQESLATRYVEYGPIPGIMYARVDDNWVKSDVWRIAAAMDILIEAAHKASDFFDIGGRFGFMDTVTFGYTMRMRLTLRHIPLDRPMSRTQSQCQMVVCPPDMLSKDIPNRLNEGWEVGLSSVTSRVNGQGYDPIILQPVEHGFLVVTKWGAEAKHPEFQNEQEN